MVHMWVNTVTGCGLPRKEINGLRFGPPVNRPPGSSVLVRSRASLHADTRLRDTRTLSPCTVVVSDMEYVYVCKVYEVYTYAYGVQIRTGWRCDARARTLLHTFVSQSVALWVRGRGCARTE